MQFLKANTAVDVLIGPFVDITDGITAETGESPTVKLSKNGQTLAAKNDVTTPVHDADGYYNCELDATDTNTEGTLVLTVAATANAAPIRHEFMVLAEAAYDSLLVAKDSGYMDVNVKAVSEDTGAADNLEADYDGTGYNKSASTIGTCTTNTDLVTAASIADAVWDEATAGHVGAGSTGAALTDILADTNELQTDDVPGLIAALNDPTAAAIADAVLDEALSGHVAAGSLGKAIADIESDATAILADTNELQTDDVPGLIAALNDPTAAAIADAVLDEALSGHVTAGTLGKAVADIETDATAILADTSTLEARASETRLAELDPANIPADLDVAKTNTENILTDTDELQIDLTDGGRLDLILDAILVDTGTTVPATIAAINTKLGTPAGVDMSTDIAAIQADTNAIEVDTQDIQSKIGTPVTSVAADIAAVQADLPLKLTKNTAFTGFMFKMVDETDGYTPETGKTITAERSLDGAAFAACANSATEVSAGWYKINLDATDTNGNMVVLKFTSTGCRAAEFIIVTQAS